LIGSINIKVGGFSVGLGNAGGLLLSGIFVSSIVSRLRFFGSTPNAARNVLEDLGLVAFVAIWASMRAPRSWSSSPGQWH
jgi:putative transport protein